MSIGLSLGNYGVIIQEVDGSPSGFGTKIKVTNNALIDNGDGSFTLDFTVGGVTDHGALSGLSDDDHTQYGFLLGRIGGQILIGGTEAGDDLTLNSTSHATKGTIAIGSTLYADEVNNRIGLGTNSPIGVFQTILASAGEPFLLVDSVLGSFEGATTEANNKINAPGHGLSPTAGDLLVITSSANGNEGIYYVASYDATYITIDGTFLNTVDNDIDFTIFSGGIGISKEDGAGTQYLVGGFLKYRSLFMEYGTNDAYSRPQLHLKTTNSIIRIGSFQGDGDGIGNNYAGTGLIIYGGDAQGDIFDADNYGYCYIKNDRLGLYNDKDGVYAGYLFRVDLSDNEFYLKDNSGITTFNFDRNAGELEISSKIGILTTQALVADLTIEGGGGENIYIYRYGNNANPPSIKYWKARGTVDTPAVLSDGDATSKWEFWGYARNQGDTDDDWVRTGSMLSEVDGVDGSGRIGGRIRFLTSSGLSTTITEKFGIYNDRIEVYKIGISTAITQYGSYDLTLRCSVWDTDNVQAEDRIMYWILNAGSGADGSEPYYLSLYDNSDTEQLRIDPLSNAILIPDYILHLGDTNTGLRLQDDRFSLYAGGATWMDMQEAAQDELYIGNGILGGGADIDIFIGTSNAIQIAGDTGIITLGTAFANTSLRVLDTNASHDLIIAPGSDLSADRTLTLTTGDSDRMITLNGNPTLDDWFDQAIKQDSSPTFGGLTMNGNVTLTKTGTATVGNPYPSRDLILVASSWKTLGSQAEDRNFTIRNIGESDSHGDHYLSFLDNDSDELLRIFSDQTSFHYHSIQIPLRLGHIGDDDNYLEFDDDNITFIVGGTFNGCEFEISETGTDTSYFGFDSGNGQLKQRYFNKSVADDGTISLGISATYAIWGKIIATETDGTMGEWAEFIIDGSGDVTLINNSANVVVNADTDNNLCIGTSASQEPLTIKNRLGGSRRLLCKIWWS